MMKRFLTTSLAMILVLMCASVTLAIDMGIVTGGLKGTYYQFGLNMQRLVQQNGINLKVANSKGSVENIYAVYKRPHTQLGLVQSDVLAFVSRVQTDPILKRIAQKIKLVFPLYNEEIHLVGNRDIRDFDDLAGKKVAIGKEGSGTYLTSKLLFEISEIEPAELLAIGTDEALAQLKAGRIDAMFYVAGVPVKLFQENVSERDELSVIPILNKNLTEFYPLAKIPAKTYPWQIEPVNTIAVKCALVTFNFRGINCDYVGRFANIIHENLEWLQINGHPKWNLVDLNYPLKGWQQYDCVQKYLGKRERIQRRKPAAINPVLDAIKSMM
ncbi:MAG: TAXI family TRAP transporter solute-binding subunit [Desulfobacterales bacterium]